MGIHGDGECSARPCGHWRSQWMLFVEPEGRECIGHPGLKTKSETCRESIRHEPACEQHVPCKRLFLHAFCRHPLAGANAIDGR